MNEELYSDDITTKLDRLADGELSEAERRDLLLELERRPDGWRRCALTFLETQCIRLSLGKQARSANETNAPRRSTFIAPRRTFSQKLTGPVGTALATSACFLIALGLGGLWMRDGGTPGALPSGMNIAANQPNNVPTQTTNDVSKTPWKMVQLQSSGAAEPLQVPAMERSQIDEQWLASVPQALPEDVLKKLREAGRSVQTSRELMRVRLQDGRQLIVPVDQITVEGPKEAN